MCAYDSRHAGEGREGKDVDGRDKPAMTMEKLYDMTGNAL